MEVSNEKYKDFVFSSISENEQYKKVFIVSLHDDKEHMKENIPYVTIVSNRYLFKLNNDQISSLEIPTGSPLIIELTHELKINNCKYLDKDRAKDLVIF